METWSRSAPTGFTTKSTAPDRMALTTVSIEPCAVCTTAGISMLSLAHGRQNTEPVEPRHDEVENHEFDRLAGPHHGKSGIAILGRRSVP